MISIDNFSNLCSMAARVIKIEIEIPEVPTTLTSSRKVTKVKKKVKVKKVAKKRAAAKKPAKKKPAKKKAAVKKKVAKKAAKKKSRR